MKIKNSEFRQLAHSIKYLEYYWSTYKLTCPEKASSYKHSSDIERFIEQDKYQELLKTKKKRLSSDKIISKQQRREILTYSKICDDLKKKLNA